MDNFEAPEVVMTDTERILQLELAQYQLLELHDPIPYDSPAITTKNRISF